MRPTNIVARFACLAVLLASQIAFAQVPPAPPAPGCTPDPKSTTKGKAEVRKGSTTDSSTTGGVWAGHSARVLGKPGSYSPDDNSADSGQAYNLHATPMAVKVDAFLWAEDGDAEEMEKIGAGTKRDWTFETICQPLPGHNRPYGWSFHLMNVVTDFDYEIKTEGTHRRNVSLSARIKPILGTTQTISVEVQDDVTATTQATVTIGAKADSTKKLDTTADLSAKGLITKGLKIAAGVAQTTGVHGSVNITHTTGYSGSKTLQGGGTDEFEGILWTSCRGAGCNPGWYRQRHENIQANLKSKIISSSTTTSAIESVTAMFQGSITTTVQDVAYTTCGSNTPLTTIPPGFGGSPVPTPKSDEDPVRGPTTPGGGRGSTRHGQKIGDSGLQHGNATGWIQFAGQGTSEGTPGRFYLVIRDSVPTVHVQILDESLADMPGLLGMVSLRDIDTGAVFEVSPDGPFTAPVGAYEVSIPVVLDDPSFVGDYTIQMAFDPTFPDLNTANSTLQFRAEGVNVSDWIGQEVTNIDDYERKSVNCWGSGTRVDLSAPPGQSFSQFGDPTLIYVEEEPVTWLRAPELVLDPSTGEYYLTMGADEDVRVHVEIHFDGFFLDFPVDFQANLLGEPL